MKKLFTITFASLLLASCAANNPNYYLKDFEVISDLQSKSTSEVIFNNVVYAKALSEEKTSELFGEDFEDKTVVFFKAENLGNDVSYFDLSKAKVINEENQTSRLVTIGEITSNDSVDLSEIENYSNPFTESEMENNNYAYNINNRFLTSFALEPRKSTEGYLIFKSLNKPKLIDFFITSGSSIYTARDYKINLDK